MGAKLGQHFLIDEGVRDAIVAAAELDAGEQAVEIGPGKGILTRAILESGAKLIAVEMDGSLALALARRFSCEPRLRVIHSNFLKLDSSELGAQSVKFVANLPYAVGTPILQRILSRHLWTSAVLMFQKEVAERITAQPGGPDYGLLTLSTLLYAEAELLMEAPKTCFSPRPRVDSAVLRLRRRQAPLIVPYKMDSFFRVAKAAFSQRRKMAVTPLASALNIPKERVAEALRRCAISPSARAQEIPLEAYLKLPSELGIQ
ncbi:MAG: ribosomal RNA small subunit methyltransferase A [Elusimicrobia bacterium RIFCSPHIGHO2_02_FULL_57_9]|nr:MAG: ribosomal RNA small subunit methyltransferase A [Elusimicrobia bacterium RIFCSPHIGHO2_02_FULL_57_9]